MVRVYVSSGVNPDYILISVENGNYKSQYVRSGKYSDDVIKTSEGKSLEEVYKYKPGYWVLAVDNKASLSEVERCLNCNE